MWKNFLIFLVAALFVYLLVQSVGPIQQEKPSTVDKYIKYKTQAHGPMRTGYTTQAHGPMRTGYNGIAYIDDQMDQYPAYYVGIYDEMNGDSEKCLSLPKVQATCVNRMLMETGGDMAQSIRECRAQGRVISGCKYNRCKHGFYPYMPQYVTLKKSFEYPVHVSLNAPQPYVKLVPSDSDDFDYVS
jgi:hypothetical protein